MVIIELNRPSTSSASLEAATGKSPLFWPYQRLAMVIKMPIRSVTTELGIFTDVCLQTGSRPALTLTFRLLWLITLAFGHIQGSALSWDMSKFLILDTSFNVFSRIALKIVFISLGFNWYISVKRLFYKIGCRWEKERKQWVSTVRNEYEMKDVKVDKGVSKTRLLLASA